jgi:hypothetical protein
MLSFTPRSNLGRLPVPRLGAAIRVEPLLCCGKCRVELLEQAQRIWIEVTDLDAGKVLNNTCA